MNVVKPSDVLRDAAELLLNPDARYAGCCGAIKDVFGGSKVKANAKVRLRAYELFSSLYKPHNKSEYEYWFHRGGYGKHKPKHQQHRATALLLTADMAESVGE